MFAADAPKTAGGACALLHPAVSGATAFQADRQDRKQQRPPRAQAMTRQAEMQPPRCPLRAQLMRTVDWHHDCCNRQAEPARPRRGSIGGQDGQRPRRGQVGALRAVLQLEQARAGRHGDAHDDGLGHACRARPRRASATVQQDRPCGSGPGHGGRLGPEMVIWNGCGCRMRVRTRRTCRFL